MRKQRTPEQKAADNARSKAWRDANPDKARAGVRKWLEDPVNRAKKQAADRAAHQADKERRNARRKQWDKEHPGHTAKLCREHYAKDPLKYRAKLLQRRYGITLADYDQMLLEQGGKCDICNTDTPGGQGAFHVDHDHSMADQGPPSIRGLLCHQCNTGLGLANDDPDLLFEAIAYLNYHRETDDNG